MPSSRATEAALGSGPSQGDVELPFEAVSSSVSLWDPLNKLGAVANPGAIFLGAGHAAPDSHSAWLQGLTEVKSLVDLGIGLVWGWTAGYAKLCNSSARPSRAARLSKGGLFPLPVLTPSLPKSGLADLPSGEKLKLAVQCWVALGCVALNAMYGCLKEGWTRKPGKVHAAALESMSTKVERFLRGEVPVSFSFADAVVELKERKVSYTGEEIMQPHSLTPEQIIKGLPPVGHGGAISILQFLKGRTRYLMEKNPHVSLVPLEDRELLPTIAKVHISKGRELEVFELLTSRGVVKWLPIDQCYSDKNGEYLSGLFGVVKPGKFTQDHQPVLRVIMNLVPINNIFTVLRGDIDCLPNPTQWMNICLDDGDVISLSQGDMASAFYLFATPSCWQPYMCFNFKAKVCRLKVDGLDPNTIYRPACAVLPMGWSSSVGVMQAV